MKNINKKRAEVLIKRYKHMKQREQRVGDYEQEQRQQPATKYNRTSPRIAGDI